MKNITLIFLLLMPVFSFTQEIEVHSSCINNNNISFGNSIGIGAKLSYSVSPKYKLEIGIVQNPIKWVDNSLNFSDTTFIKTTTQNYSIIRTAFHLSFLYNAISINNFNLFVGPFVSLQNFHGVGYENNIYYNIDSVYETRNTVSINSFNRLTAGINLKIEFSNIFIKKLSFVVSLMPGVIIDNNMFENNKGISDYFFYPRLFNETHLGLKYYLKSKK
jgi:hypothetical protein